MDRDEVDDDMTRPVWLDSASIHRLALSRWSLKHTESLELSYRSMMDGGWERQPQYYGCLMHVISIIIIVIMSTSKYYVIHHMIMMMVASLLFTSSLTRSALNLRSHNLLLSPSRLTILLLLFIETSSY